jgi:transcriptional regulator with GAF, ATPase, and Fis domain
MNEEITLVSRTVSDRDPPPSSRVRATDLETLAAKLVGLNDVEHAQERLKRAMLYEALLRTEANFAKAGDLLGVTRQAIQQMVARYELRQWAQAVRAHRAVNGPGD